MSSPPSCALFENRRCLYAEMTLYKHCISFCYAISWKCFHLLISQVHLIHAWGAHPRPCHIILRGTMLDSSLHKFQAQSWLWSVHSTRLKTAVMSEKNIRYNSSVSDSRYQVPSLESRGKKQFRFQKQWGTGERYNTDLKRQFVTVLPLKHNSYESFWWYIDF